MTDLEYGRLRFARELKQIISERQPPYYKPDEVLRIITLLIEDEIEAMGESRGSAILPYGISAEHGTPRRFQRCPE